MKAILVGNWPKYVTKYLYISVKKYGVLNSFEVYMHEVKIIGYHYKTFR